MRPLSLIEEQDLNLSADPVATAATPSVDESETTSQPGSINPRLRKVTPPSRSSFWVAGGQGRQQGVNLLSRQYSSEEEHPADLSPNPETASLRGGACFTPRPLFSPARLEGSQYASLPAPRPRMPPAFTPNLPQYDMVRAAAAAHGAPPPPHPNGPPPVYRPMRPMMRHGPAAAYRAVPTNRPGQPNKLAEFPADDGSMVVRKLLMAALFAIYVILVICFVIFVITGSNFGIFENGFFQSLELGSTCLQPAAEGYIIYLILHVWNISWVVWGLSANCQTRSQGCFRTMPPVLSSLFIFEVIFGLLSQIVWLFLWDINSPMASLWVLSLQFLSFLSGFAIMSSNILKYCFALETTFYPEYCFIKTSAQNGVAGLMSISLFEVFLSFHSTISSEDLYILPEDIAATLVLSLLAVSLIVYFVLDVLIFEKSVRFIVAPYLVITWCSCATLFSKRHVNTETNVIILCGVIFISAILAATRVILSIFNHKKFATNLTRQFRQ